LGGGGGKGLLKRKKGKTAGSTLGCQERVETIAQRNGGRRKNDTGKGGKDRLTKQNFFLVKEEVISDANRGGGGGPLLRFFENSAVRSC